MAMGLVFYFSVVELGGGFGYLFRNNRDNKA